MRVAGFGFRSCAGADSLAAAFARAGGKADALATVENKVEGLKPLSQTLQLPLLAVTRAALAAQSRPGAQMVWDRYGTGSVAESAALAAAGPGAVLVVHRVTSPDGLAVVAIAEGPA